MKIHLTATAAVMSFAVFVAEVSRTELIVLVLTCALVMSLEIVNTAIERLTDKVSPDFSPLAKIAKDTSAGAVLLACIAAVIIAVILFGETTVSILKGISV
jgi:diacylglycerol kinase